MGFSWASVSLAGEIHPSRAGVVTLPYFCGDVLRQRIGQAQVDMNLAVKDAKQQAGEAAASARSTWAQMKTDAAARMDDLQAKIDKRAQQLDARAAASDADRAEGDAADAIDYAQWTVDNARLAVLDAIDARAYADERARAAGS